MLDAAQLGVLRGYGCERDVAAGDVLFADGDQSYDLIVLLAGTADVVEGYGESGASVVASYGSGEFLGEIGMLTGQRAFLSAVATSAGRVLAVPLEELRRVMAQEPGLSDLILRTFLLRHSLLMSRGTGLTLIGSRFDADTRRLLEVLARNRLVWTWLDLEASPEAEQILRGLDVPVADLPIIVVPGGPVLRNPGSRALLDALAISGDVGLDPPACATCLSWAQARPASRPRSTAPPRAWRQHWRKTPHSAARRAPRHGLRTTSVFPRACPGRNSQPGGRCRRRNSASVSSWPRKLPHYRSRMACIGSHSMTARPSRPGRSSSQPAPGTTGFPWTTWPSSRASGCTTRRPRQKPRPAEPGRSLSSAAATPPGRLPFFLSRTCTNVHVIIRRGALDASMSRYLVDRIERTPRIVVWPSTQVTTLTGASQLQAVQLHREGQPEASGLAVTGLFVFIGAKPGTGWLAGQLAEDSHGFLLTGSDIPATRLENRNLTPSFLETSRPGIFAVGDVRSGSVKRVAAAIGEGSMAVRLAYERLQSAGQADPMGLPAAKCSHQPHRGTAH